MFATLHLALLLAAAICAAPLPRVLTAPTAAANAQRPATPARAADPVPQIQALTRRLAEGQVELDARVEAELTALIAEARLIWLFSPERGREVAAALLDLMGLFLDARSADARGAASAPTPQGRLRDLAAEVLRARMEGDLPRWLAQEVLVTPRLHPLPRRLAVARLFEQRAVPVAKLALLICTREEEPRLRRAALEALSGWNDETVHATFLDELERALGAGGGAGIAPAERHFARVRLEAGSRALPRLMQLARAGLVGGDWRAASRSVALTRPLAHEQAVPFLIEALETWKRRSAAGAQGLRLSAEIARELEARSSRKLGLDPDAWRTWWEAVRRGEGGATTVRGGGAPLEATRASFFGLKPQTDRVVFVIDRSGSMETALQLGTRAPGRKARRRWDEAVAQLLSCLEGLGEQTRFGIVLFHDIGEPWREPLLPATRKNLRLAREWLEAQLPNGGTRLRAGVERALLCDPDGRPDLARLEADTLILLCDGATAEGPGWVEGFLRGTNESARVVFHGVQIGPGGDGTLERLAQGSGGDFVRVDG